MRSVLKVVLSLSLFLNVSCGSADLKSSGSKFKNSGMDKYSQKDYAGAVTDFDKYLAENSTDNEIILLRGLSRSLLKPEDVEGACADFLVVKSALAGMNVEKYCEGQVGW